MVRVRRPAPGTKVNDTLHNSGTATTEAEPYIVTGTVGEEWCCSLEKLVQTYNISREDAEGIGDHFTTLCTRVGSDATVVLAALMPVEGGVFEVITPTGNVLSGNQPGLDHAWGDFIITSMEDSNDQWVVNGRVFFNTYQLV